MPDSSAMKELPLRVRNTFIEGCPSAVRSGSLEPFLRCRKVHSCPSSPVGRHSKDDAAYSPRSTQVCDSDTDVSLSGPSTSQEDDWEGSHEMHDQDLHAEATDTFGGLSTPMWEEMPLCGDVFNVMPWNCGMAAECVEAVFCDATALPTDAFWAGCCESTEALLTDAFWSGGFQSTEVPILCGLGDQGNWYVAQQAVADESNREPRLELSLAEALEVPATSPTRSWREAHEVGMAVVHETDASSFMEQAAGSMTESGSVDGLSDLPSAGSAGHSIGLCKPCSFLHSTAGCSKGQRCHFCHLCNAGARRQQKKEQLRRKKLP